MYNFLLWSWSCEITHRLKNSEITFRQLFFSQLFVPYFSPPRHVRRQYPFLLLTFSPTFLYLCAPFLLSDCCSCELLCRQIFYILKIYSKLTKHDALLKIKAAVESSWNKLHLDQLKMQIKCRCINNVILSSWWFYTFMILYIYLHFAAISVLLNAGLLHVIEYFIIAVLQLLLNTPSTAMFYILIWNVLDE